MGPMKSAFPYQDFKFLRYKCNVLTIIRSHMDSIEMTMQALLSSTNWSFNNDNGGKKESFKQSFV